MHRIKNLFAWKSALVIAYLFFSMQPLKLAQLHAAAHGDDGRVVEYRPKPLLVDEKAKLREELAASFSFKSGLLRLLPDHHQLLLLGPLQLTPMKSLRTQDPRGPLPIKKVYGYK